jgi:hypothetical protein
MRRFSMPLVTQLDLRGEDRYLRIGCPQPSPNCDPCTAYEIRISMDSVIGDVCSSTSVRFCYASKDCVSARRMRVTFQVIQNGRDIESKGRG